MASLRPIIAATALAALALAPPAGAGPAPPTGDAPITIIEFTDFECPFCARVQPTLSALVDRYGDRIAFELRHLPLASHPRADPAARTAIAAAAQGKGLKMRQILFERAEELEDGDLLTYARVLGLDLLRFGLDMSSAETQVIIDRDRAIARAVGAKGTPNFFINGHQVRGAQPIEAFARVIDEELAALDATGPDGPRGAAFARARTQQNNPDLYRFVYLGETPPEPAPEPPASPPPLAEKVWRVTIAPDDAARGDASAPVTLVVFSNYQCPFSARLAPVVDALAAKYRDALRVVFKHHPLPFHDRAMPAAIAAVCAGRQQRFWGFHERASASSRALSDEDLLRFAVEAGVERRAFERCLADPTARARVEQDIALATRVEARGTPTSYVNGRKIGGARPQSDFEAAIDAALAAPRPEGGYDAIIAEGAEFKPLADAAHAFELAKRPRIGRAARAAVPIVVFTDYECPFSRRMWRTFLADVERDLGRAVTLHVKHFPLSHHPLAETLARAVMCAEEQGRGRRLHDRLVAADPEPESESEPEPEPVELDEPAEGDERRGLAGGEMAEAAVGGPGHGASAGGPIAAPDPMATLRERARQAGLNLRRFDACLAAERHADLVAADLEEGRAAGVRGTPTVFVDGRLYRPSGAYRVEDLGRVVEEVAAERKEKARGGGARR